MKLRTVIFWPHLIAGVIAGAIILLMSVTGVLLTYERQLIRWSDSHLRSDVPDDGAARLPVETLLQTLRRDHPDLQPSALTVGSAADATVAVTVPGRTIHLDAYSGRLLGEGATGVRQMMSDLRSWHRWLAMEGDSRPLGKAIAGWSNVLFLFIVASGFYLWFPRKWTWPSVRAVALFRGGLRGKARDFNWHNVIGLWSAVPLFIVVLSAVPISFRWASDAVYRSVGEDPPAQGGGRGAAAGGRGAAAGGRGAAPGGGAAALDGGAAAAGGRAAAGGGREEPAAAAADADGPAPYAGLNQLWSRAAQQVPGWRTINLRVPESPRAPVVFAIDQGDGGQPQLRSTLTLDRASGEVVTYEHFASLTLGRRIRNVMRFAHTGEVLGIPGQTVAGLVSAGGVVLVWTGIALALRRMTGWIRRRRERPSAVRTSRDAAA